MIQITRSEARQLRAILRKSVPLGSPKNTRPPVEFHAGQDGLRIRCDFGDVAVQWRLSGARPADTIIVPGKALDSFEGAKPIPVTLEMLGNDAVQARWDDVGVPQTRDVVAVSADRLPKFPDEPKRFAMLDLTLLRALDDASQTAGSDSTRQALARTQLRGKSGEIVSTNSRQLLLQRGFAFPWKDSVLIPTIGVFGARELAAEASVGVGRTDTHVCLAVNAWKFYFLIDKDGRFPRIEQAIPAQFTKGASFVLAAEDARFLAEKLPHLPGAENAYHDVTIDLNGGVVVRGRDGDKGPPTELLLNRSRSTGPSTKAVCDRTYLARSLRLGFTEFHVARTNVPIVGRDRQRLFVWAPINADDAIPASPKAIRIPSTQDAEPASPTTPVESSDQAPRIPQEPPAPRRMKPMPPANNGHASNGAANANGDPTERGQSIIDLIAEAEELRTVLLDASTRLARLLSGLKQHRRQSRAVQAAMHSLRQLKLGS